MKLKAKLLLFVPCRHIGGLEVLPYSFLTSELDGVEFCEHHAPTALLPVRNMCACSVGGWLVSRDDLHDLESGDI